MIRVEIVCDECGVVGDRQEGPGREAPHRVRRRLVAEHWFHKEAGGVDLCPSCKAKKRAASGNGVRLDLEALGEIKETYPQASTGFAEAFLNAMGSQPEEHFSGDLVAIVDFDNDEGHVELVSVKGNTESSREDRLSDVEWFNESWPVVFPETFWENPTSGRYKVKGRLHTWKNNTPDDQDWDEAFEVESLEKLGD
jgi:hypothetical protein